MQFPFTRLLPFLLVLASAPVSLAAQDSEPPPPPILSDRPGLGDGTHVMAPGAWQVEVGGQYMGHGADRWSLGQGLIRGGFEPFEVRIYTNSLVLQQTAGDSDLGLEDVGLGAKVSLGGPGAWNWAALGLVTLPIGTDAFSAGEVTAGASILGETSLTASVGLALNAGYFFPMDGPNDGSFAIILTPGFTIPAIEGLSGYAGIASYLGNGPDTNFVEAGLAYLQDADTQLDLNWGIDTDSREWFIGIGWARRWR